MNPNSSCLMAKLAFSLESYDIAILGLTLTQWTKWKNNSQPKTIFHSPRNSLGFLSPNAFIHYILVHFFTADPLPCQLQFSPHTTTSLFCGSLTSTSTLPTASYNSRTLPSLSTRLQLAWEALRKTQMLKERLCSKELTLPRENPASALGLQKVASKMLEGSNSQRSLFAWGCWIMQHSITCYAVILRDLKWGLWILPH